MRHHMFVPSTPTSARAIAPVLLLAAGDARLRVELRNVLLRQLMRVVEAVTWSEALAHAAAHNPDLVILDLDLPTVAGVEATRLLRESTAAPILVLSERRDESEQIGALDAGANAFMTKPLATAELLARIRVWLRHTQRAQAGLLNAVLDVGPFRIDFDRRLAFREGREVRLTPKQYRLFATMMRNAGKVLTREQILVSVWGPAYARETQYLRVYMAQLRRKFEVDAGRPRFFVTEPNVGYRLRAL
jgi:two-component system KDP operon response regulator KdpE